MNYLCLSFQDDQQADELGARESAALQSELDKSLAELRQSGNLIASTIGIPPAAATTVRVRNGRMVLTDGPAPATKSFLSGFTIISARDLNDAVRLAARNPVARTGRIEVHPLPGLHVAASAPSAPAGSSVARGRK